MTKVPQPDALPASVPQLESTFSQYYSSPEDHDEDSVMGNFNNSDEHFQSSSNEIDEDLSIIPTSSASYSASELHSAFTNEPSDQYMVLYNGNAEVVGNFRALNFYKASDINIKEDVRLLIENEQRDPRSVLLKIDGVEYKFKDSVRHTTNKRFVGYIAQQIESVVPEAVQLIDGILHVDYESLIPYLSESIKQNFKDITEMKADISDFKQDSRHLHRVIDSMYKEFVKKEQDRSKKPTNGAAQSRQQSRNRFRWIIGTSLAVLLLVSVAIGVFFIVPFIHSSQNGSNPPSPEVQHPSPSESPTARPRPFPSIDQDTLVALYHATGGDSWFIRIGSLLSISVCEWPPVTCDSDFRVIKLEFDSGLTGTLPNSIGRLDKLQTLRMSSIRLYGTIPASIGNLTNLVRLDLHGLGVTGTVPSEIFSLPLVKDLVLKNNEFLSWTIPPQIASMKRLENFDARHSGLHGTIPDEISQLTNLKRLNLEDNDLTGTVPSLANTNVTQLYLTNNQLTGPVPKMNEKLLLETDGHQEGFYVSVELANNSFSGEFDIPLALWMDQIGHFDITNNQFTSVSSRFDSMTNNSLTCKAEGNPFKCPIPEHFKTLCKATCT